MCRVRFIKINRSIKYSTLIQTLNTQTHTQTQIQLHQLSFYLIPKLVVVNKYTYTSKILQKKSEKKTLKKDLLVK